MCGRFTVTTDPALLAERFEAAMPEGWTERYNVAPSQEVLAVVEREDKRELRLLKWGLVPHWAKEPKVGNKMINARAESVAEKSMYRALMAKGRCLLVADGFYEWRKDPDGTKRPVRYTLADGSPFAFAGLRAFWRDPDGGDPIASCTIVTTTANDLVAPVHDRMPVILRREDEARWLDRDVPPEEALELLQPLPAELMSAADASLLVNSPDNDVPEILDPLA